MVGVEHKFEQEEYLLCLVPAQSRRLLAFREGSHWRLPKISILKWARRAEQLQDAVRNAWGFNIIVLDFPASGYHGSRWVVAETPFGQGSTGLSAIGWEQMEEGNLSPEQKDSLRSIFAGERGPFSRPGWIEEAIVWVESAIPKATVQRDRIRQYSAGGGFALVRFALGEGRACWLKATGAPNRHELSVTRLLAEIYPQGLPPFLASRRDWNAWLMEDAGEPNKGRAQPTSLDDAATALASLQKACRTKCSELLGAGAFDLRIGLLQNSIPALIEYLSLAMEHQISTKAPRLSQKRLSEIGELLKRACEWMAALCIPDTLLHNDMNQGNILRDGPRCVFIDWCEASVGNPFLTFEHLALLADSDAERARLRELYKTCWSDSLSQRQIERAFCLAPLLAVTSYLYGRGDWLSSPRRNDPSVESYARSLARHMDRAAQTVNEEVLCK